MSTLDRQIGTSRAQLAIVLSIAFHAALIYALSLMQWASPAERPPPTPVVWLEDRRPVEPEPTLEEESPLVSAADVFSEAAVEALPRASDDPPAITERPPAGVAPPPSTERDERIDDPDEPATESVADEALDEPGPEIDWYEEGREAVARLMEQSELDEAYSSFSQDLFDEAAQAAPGPRQDLFDRRSKNSRSFARPGQQRTVFGRWLAETCNALTGGFSVMGFASLCADEQERATFFADIKPEYLRSLPVCTEVEVQRPWLAGTDEDGPLTAVKCELVAMGD